MQVKVRFASAATILALALAGCGSPAPQPEASEAATAAPEAPPGITLSDARVQLPLVSGRPGAAYFTVSQANGAPRRIVGVAVEMAARAEMHQTSGGAMTPVTEVPVGPGKTIKFEPGGYHAMLFDLDPKLRFARDAELTVTFDGGDKASARASVTTMQERMDMEMKH